MVPRTLRRFGGLAPADLGVLAAMLVAAIWIGVTVVRLPSVVGAYLDDGIYMVTGRALADGQGYRHLELPGEPVQTKYPVLYPLLLSFVWRAFPNLPANIPVFQTLNVAMWGLGSWLAYRLMCRAWGLPWWLAAGGALLAFGNTMTITVLRTPFAEPLYFVMSMGALLLVASTRDTPPAEKPRGRWAGTALGSLLAAASYLTRSIGLAAMLAVVLDMLLRRRWKPLLVTVGIVAITAGGWSAWRHAAKVANNTKPSNAALRYDLDYGSWLVTDARTAARVVYHNLSALALANFEEVVQPPAGVVDRLLGSGPRAAMPVYAGMLVVSALLVLGLVATLRRSHAVIHLYLAGYLSLVLVWPYQPSRFLIPILPLLATLVLVGLGEIVRRVAVFLSGTSICAGEPTTGTHGPVLSRWAAASSGISGAFRVTIVVTLLLAYARVQPLVSPDEQQLQAREGLADAERQREALADFLRDATPPDAVVSARYGGYLHLSTGRKFVPVVPGDNPIPMNYPADRPFWGCGRVITEDMRAADRRFAEERVREHLNATGATHVVPVENRETYYWQVFDRLLRLNPGLLRRVGTAGPYELYEIRGPLRG